MAGDEGRKTLRMLEMVLFVAVFGVGTWLSALAVFGEPDGAASSAAGRPVPLPAPGSATPGLPPPLGDPGVPPPGDVPEGELVQVQGARADITPPVGCSAHITFIWELDRSTLPPGRVVAELVLNGPAKDGPYDRPVLGGEVRFEIDVPLSGHDEWTADILTVDGRPVFPTPLPVSFDNPAC